MTTGSLLLGFEIELIHKNLAQVSKVARYKLNSFGTGDVRKPDYIGPFMYLSEEKFDLIIKSLKNCQRSCSIYQASTA